jgi:hypothetical protein
MESHVYVLVHATEPRLKVGKANNVFCRLLSLGLSKVVDVERSFAIRARSADEAFKLERQLHKELAAWRLRPEDFPDGGCPSKGFTEWFKDECAGNARKVAEEAAQQDSGLRMMVFTETRPVEEAGCDLARLSAEQLLRKLMSIGSATRHRESAYEKGMRFRQALEAGIVPSRLHLAASTGHSIGEVSRAIQIASLPAEVIDAFPSPSDIHFRWAKPLKDACQRDLPAVLDAVEHLKSKPELTAKQVLACLVASAPMEQGRQKLVVRRMKIAGKPVVFRAAGKSTVLEIDARLLPKERWAEVEKALRTLLK